MLLEHGDRLLPGRRGDEDPRERAHRLDVGAGALERARVRRRGLQREHRGQPQPQVRQAAHRLQQLGLAVDDVVDGQRPDLPVVDERHHRARPRGLPQAQLVGVAERLQARRVAVAQPLAADQHGRLQRPLAERQSGVPDRSPLTVRGAFPDRRVDTGVSFHHELTQSLELQPTQLIQRGHTSSVPPMANLGRLVAAIIVILTFTATAHAACPKGATCGRVTVPLDHSGATAGTLSIAYAKLPATGTRTGTLVLLAGGPGQAALPLTTTFAGLVKPLRASYDLVTVDQRGTGGSGAIDCPLETYADVARCATTLGPARPFLNTPETAKDLENLRQALGVDKLTLFGVSYGASVASDYVRRYPEHTAAVVLDSPTPVDGLDGVDQLRTFGTPRVLREVCYPGDCHATVPDPDEALVQAVEKLPLRGRQVLPSGRTRQRRDDRGRPLRGDQRERPQPGPALRAAGRDRLAWPRATSRRCSTSACSTAAAARAAATSTPPGCWPPSCIESLLPWAPDSPVAGRADAVKRFIAERTAAFAPVQPATVLLGSLTNFCSTWPPTPKPEAVPYAGPNVPVLVLSGRQDLRTPLESARRTALQYPNAKLLAVPGAGHSVLSTDGSGCARAGLVAFLAGQPVVACARPAKEFPAAPYAPAQLSSLRPTRLSGVPGQTFSAVTVTLTGVGYDSLAGYTRFPGLRAGYVQVRKGKLELHGVQWIKGVSVSGTIDSRGNGTLTVAGPVDGTVTYRNGKLSGTLGGQSF